MAEAGKKNGPLISQRFAIGVIVTMFAGTSAGWILTEVFPADFISHTDAYRAKWGGFIVRLFEVLKLHDPFRSFWYTAILLLFFIVLFLCIVSRWRQFVRRAFSVSVPGDTGWIDDSAGKALIDWSEPMGPPAGDRDPVSHFSRSHGRKRELGERTREELFGEVSRCLLRRRFTVAGVTGEDRIVFRAVAGRLRHIGNLVFHAGLLVITAGGMIGSMMGTSEFRYGARGDLIPLKGTGSFVRVEDFRILMGRSGMVSDYISDVSVVDSSGAVLRTSAIEVNKPLKVGAYHIYQSSYTTGEGYEWVTLGYSTGGASIPLPVTVRPGERKDIGDGSMSIVAGRLFPDFRMGPSGPYSASPRMANPAVSVMLLAPDDTLSGYLFLEHPGFNSRFGDKVSLVLKEIEPVYYTGLEIATSPGSSLMLGGMFLSAVGLILLYMFDYRMITGYLDSNRLVMCREGGRLTVSAGSQFEQIEKEIREISSKMLDNR